MKKSKKVISYLMLLVPLALPAACSPINSSGPDRQAEADEAEQLRLIVERYFEQQEQQGEISSQWIDVTDDNAQWGEVTDEDAQWVEVTDDDDRLDAVAVESEQDLQEELEGLEKTGEWTAAESRQGDQCDLPAPVAKAKPVEPEQQVVTPAPAEPVMAETDKDKVVPAPEIIQSAAVKKTACDFPVLVNRQVQYYLNLFQGKQRKNFRRWLERSSKYTPFITEELKKAGLPLELTWLAMIESGFNPSAYSRSHASGLWQFIPSTGRNFGLRIDSWADERRDPEKATKAAVAYLKSLYKRFGDWHLAVAAYNAGEGSIERGLRKYRVRNFWELAQHNYLHLETKRYVPQLIAAVLISRNPEQYGFSDIQYRTPSSYEVVKVPSGVSLKTVAASASVSLRQLRELNNDLHRDQVPRTKNGWLLKVPAGRSALVAANLPGALRKSSSGGAYSTHRVAKNETLSQISEKYNVSMTDLLKVNKLRSSKLLIGQYLRIPSSAVSSTRQLYALTKKNISAESEQTVTATTTYKLRKGETLSHVSEKYNVSVAALMKWNHLDRANKVRVGQELTVYSPQGAVQLASAEVSKNRASEAEAATTSYKLRKGETLSHISQRYNVSVAALMKWNHLDRVNKVQAGQELTIHLPQNSVQLASAAGSASNSNAEVELTAASVKSKPTATDAKIASAPQQSNPTGVITLAGNRKQKAVAAEEISYYKVRSGDSLWSISKKLQVSTGDIKDWNSLNGNMLQPGTTLMIKNG